MAQASFSRMDSKENEGGEPVDWSGLLFHSKKSVKPPSFEWNRIILAVVVFLHAFLITQVTFWRTELQKNIAEADEALQVTFIDRIVPLLEKQTAKDTNHDNRSSAARRALTKRNPPDVKVLNQEVKNETQALRLNLSIDEWQPITSAPVKNLLKRQIIALPGRVEPFVQGIRLTERPTPEQRLEMVGRLFGAVEYDACKEARNRMANFQSARSDLDVSADLRSIEQHCHR